MTKSINILLILLISIILIFIPILVIFKSKKEKFQNIVFKDSDKNILGTYPNYIKYPQLFNIKKGDIVLDDNTIEVIIPDAYMGIQGKKGDIGIKGEKGEFGPIGNTTIGIPGSKGNKGDKGDIGLKGLDVVGPKGDKGPVGTTGNIGRMGENGKNGNQGPIGITGEPGENNTIQGPKGITYNIEDAPKCVDSECIPGTPGVNGIVEKDPRYMLSINRNNYRKDLDIYANKIEFPFNNIIIGDYSELCIDNDCINKNDFSKLHKKLFDNCLCPNGIPKTYEDGCRKINEIECKQCNEGYYMKNNECHQNKCICYNGNPISDTLCENNNVHHCDNCFDGYTLIDNICVKNDCTCDNGTPSNICESDKLENCKNCNEGFILLNNLCYSPITKTVHIEKTEKTKINLNNEIKDLTDKILIDTIIFNISGEYISDDMNIGALHIDFDDILSEFTNIKNIVINNEAYITGAFGKGSSKGYAPRQELYIFYNGYNGGDGADGKDGGPGITFNASRDYKDRISVIITDNYDRIIGGFPSQGGKGGKGGRKDIYIYEDETFENEKASINKNTVDESLEICYEGICYNTQCNYDDIISSDTYFISYPDVIDLNNMIFKIDKIDEEYMISRYYMSEKWTPIKLQEGSTAEFGGGVLKATEDNNKDNPFELKQSDYGESGNIGSEIPSCNAGNIYGGNGGHPGKNGNQGIKIKTNNNIRYTYNSKTY
tara:strand:- start:19172 stop:21319 length:2148 start_codon:yes stop_codon:yes gene_type:complete